MLGLVGAATVVYGVYVMMRGGRDEAGTPGEKAGLGPIPERGIHVLAGVRITIFGVLCLAAAAFALVRFL